MLFELNVNKTPEKKGAKKNSSFNYGKGRVVYLSELIHPGGEIKLGYETKWNIPRNANEFEAAVHSAAGRDLPLQVIAPEWVGISHDTQNDRDVIHFFNYNQTREVEGIIIKYFGRIKTAWLISPDQEGKKNIAVLENNNISELRISSLKVYNLIVLEKK